jgi:hypothetical protein
MKAAARLAALMLGLFVALLAAEGQQAGKVPQLGYLTAQSLASVAAAREAFRQGLQELGYIEGTNIAIEYRFAEEKLERLPALAAELVRLKIDLIVAHTAPAALAAKNATMMVPIVMVGVGLDPVEAGLVESFARPGGNLTGLTSFGHIPSDLVVDQWVSNVESSSPRDFLLLHAPWTTFRHLLWSQITPAISMAWDFTTKSGGICVWRPAEPETA